MITAATTYTPAGLWFDEASHRYTLLGEELISVTRILQRTGLSSMAFCDDPAARERGTRAHAAIALMCERESYDPGDATIDGYLDGWRLFLAESAFRIDASEERLADPDLGVAGTLDLRGLFPGRDRIDVIDIKTGAVPPWVGYQTAGYVRLLPPIARRFARRWCLQLPGDGRYKLLPLIQRSDETVFVAAATVARAQDGWR